jgi:hypothetical protein
VRFFITPNPKIYVDVSQSSKKLLKMTIYTCYGERLKFIKNINKI